MTDDFQRAASEQGRGFEQAVETTLRIAGCAIVARRRLDPSSGEEIDLVIRTPGGREIWVESKGSWRGVRPGLRRSDTAKKAVATAWHLHQSHAAMPPYVLITSHKPVPSSYPAHLIDDAVASGLFDEVLELGDLKAAILRLDQA
ncbi:MAG: nuclease-related domain-containing protein [bacterium]